MVLDLLRMLFIDQFTYIPETHLAEIMMFRQFEKLLLNRMHTIKVCIGL